MIEKRIKMKTIGPKKSEWLNCKKVATSKKSRRKKNYVSTSVCLCVCVCAHMCMIKELSPTLV